MSLDTDLCNKICKTGKAVAVFVFAIITFLSDYFLTASLKLILRFIKHFGSDKQTFTNLVALPLAVGDNKTFRFYAGVLFSTDSLEV